MLKRKVFTMKLDRLASGGQPRVLDLFAGCGGISLGFNKAGFDIVGAVEFDDHAAKTHALNFHGDINDEALYTEHAKARDITTTEPEELIKDLQLEGGVAGAIDLIVGGPPCQAFTRVGRAKLRQIAEHPEAFLQDPRSNLYLRYLHYVAKMKPIALLMENVPDVLNFGGHNVAEEACETLEYLGYTCNYTMLNAVHYGVPEMRERMFLVAYANELKVDVSFPAPSHSYNLPKGYHGSRQVALKTVHKKDLLDEKHFFREAPKPEPKLPPAVTTEQAIADLPKITLHLEGKLKRGARRFVDLIPYDNRRKVGSYGMLMKTWPNFSNSIGVYDHLIRYLPRDYPLFNRMNHGDQYPEAHQHALDMLEEKVAQLKSEGIVIKKETKEYELLKKEIVPPYDPGKFPNKWRKMEPDQPARTLMAHLGKDSYSHIHYDCDQSRTISIREAARLQSFPDGFTFSGTMNPAFKQIGNAVAPLMAYAVANKMKNTIDEGLSNRRSIEYGAEAAPAIA
jgi:DNA (cytosine-5)-methyltransferase 1